MERTIEYRGWTLTTFQMPVNPNYSTAYCTLAQRETGGHVDMFNIEGETPERAAHYAKVRIDAKGATNGL